MHSKAQRIARSASPCREITRMLSMIKLSASGCDEIPAWLLRQCSYELADIVAYIINCLVISGKVPSYWRNALVTPVPKVSKPTVFSDFHPISVTPLISRLTERIIVQWWILPSVPPDMLRDQYAFKPILEVQLQPLSTLCIK